MLKGFQTSRQTLNAQENTSEQDLHCLKNKEKTSQQHLEGKFKQ
jgi:hypothetical protein